ncbi:MAG: MBL fold metallo-hydrolase [Acidobacteriota bacterium]|nr:MBL fold metallo-hydrolase [Acidobacteriota bacterium]
MAVQELYFRQLLAGESVAKVDPTAGQMRNFMYLIGDPTTHEAVIVDPAWDVDGLISIAEDDDYRITGALVTHYHPDHVGGEMFGMSVQGVARLLERYAVPLHVNKHEAEGLKRVTSVSDTDMQRVDDGDELVLGERKIQFIHTPGHTPGSQCFLVDGLLVAGDTLFVQGCGRVDLPGSDPDAMYHSLTGKLAKLPENTILYPGHDYGPSRTSTIGDELRHNFYMRMTSLDDWHQLMG